MLCSYFLYFLWYAGNPVAASILLIFRERTAGLGFSVMDHMYVKYSCLLFCCMVQKSSAAALAFCHRNHLHKLHMYTEPFVPNIFSGLKKWQSGTNKNIFNPSNGLHFLEYEGILSLYDKMCKKQTNKQNSPYASVVLAADYKHNFTASLVLSTDGSWNLWEWTCSMSKTCDSGLSNFQLEGLLISSYMLRLY